MPGPCKVFWADNDERFAKGTASLEMLAQFRDRQRLSLNL